MLSCPLRLWKLRALRTQGITFLGIAIAFAATVAWGAAGLRGQRALTPVLLSVSFSVPPLGRWTDTVAQEVSQTPYTGIAARLGSAYALGPAPVLGQFRDVAKWIRRDAPGRVWPWVFLNRMVADGGRTGSRRSQRAGTALTTFAGADLDGTGGARAVFLETFRTALRLAKETGSPGVVLDPELYSDYRIADLRTLAQMRGVPTSVARAEARALGAQLAKVVGQEYPNAVVLSLFTQLERPNRDALFIPTVFLGLLREAEDKHIPLTLVDGGETLGYCPRSMGDLKTRERARTRDLGAILSRFGGQFAIGGTLAMWSDMSRRSGFLVKQERCRDSAFRSVTDFEAPLVELLRRYGYVWVYGAGSAPYAPLSDSDRAVFDPVLARALHKAEVLGPYPTTVHRP